MRILVSAGPMYGHVNSVLPLAVAAQRAGHEVVLATGSELVPHVERRGLTGWAAGPSHAENGGVDTPWMEYFAIAAEKRALDLVPRAADWKPDLVVHEETELAGPVVAACTDARLVVHGLGLMPPVRIWDAFAPTINRLLRQWEAPAAAGSVRDATYLELCPPSLRPPGERVWSRARPLRPVGGQPAPGERLPAAMADLPYASTVHLTLGTVFNHAPDVLAAAIAGLRDLPVNLVVTTGPGVDPDRFAPQPPHVLVTSYVPHALLLPRCRLVVSQGGAGILFGALAHGLPQLVLPQGADQTMNADACREAGAGLSLAAVEVTPEAVRTAATRLLAEPGFAAAARVVQTEIDAMPGAGPVLAALGREAS
jgi:UDP:flavonoid glycosyltransferase YjiC (YdhE family)